MDTSISVFYTVNVHSGSRRTISNSCRQERVRSMSWTIEMTPEFRFVAGAHRTRFGIVRFPRTPKAVLRSFRKALRPLKNRALDRTSRDPRRFDDVITLLSRTASLVACPIVSCDIANIT